MRKGCDCRMTKLEIIADGRKIIHLKKCCSLWIRYDSIYECYKNPSINKIKIWGRIEENAKKIDATVGIGSKSDNFFSAVGFFLDEKYNHVDFKITKDYCYIAIS